LSFGFSLAAFETVRTARPEALRIYLLDLPDGFSARVLAIAFVADQGHFAAMVEEEVPRILDTFEFRTP